MRTEFGIRKLEVRIPSSEFPILAVCSMKIRSPALMSLGGFLGASLMRSWMSRLDYKAIFFDRGVDPTHPACCGRKIFVFWHEYILFPIFLESLTSVAVLLSRHGDADVLTHLISHFRLNAVRGSTQRGGTAATRELARKGSHMHLVITPTGPAGRAVAWPSGRSTWPRN